MNSHNLVHILRRLERHPLISHCAKILEHIICISQYAIDAQDKSLAYGVQWNCHLPNSVIFRQPIKVVGHLVIKLVFLRRE